MLRFKSLHTPRVSNSLAVLAAVILLISALAGSGNSVVPGKDSANRDGELDSVASQLFATEEVGGNTHKKNKSFKVSLFLFRID
jgi:hypothetical protein